MKVCVICGDRTTARGMCKRHYDHWRRTGIFGEFVSIDSFVNPLVCNCTQPLADPAKNWGECARCKRKPLALMVAS